MPVIGHAFVGLILARWTHPSPDASAADSRPTIGTILWAPLLVGLSYLPDIVAQVVLFISGGSDIRVGAHAAPCAVAASLVLAPFLARFMGVSRSRMFVVVLICLLIHDVLDLFQATDRTLWWPFSDRRIGSVEPIIPTSPIEEAVLFAVLFLIAFIAHQLIVWFRRDRVQIVARATQNVSPYAWLNVAVTSIMMLLAGITHHLRQVREEQFRQAEIYAQEKHAYSNALVLLEAADRWPSTTKPGRIDYLRAWTYEQLGDRHRAEEYYLRSDYADPMYFWNLVDLAAFYAVGPEPLPIREQRVAPYVQRLRQDFADHPDFAVELARIAQRLARPPAPVSGGPTSTGLTPNASGR